MPPHLGPQRDIAVIGKDQPLVRGQLFGVPPHVGQALNPLGIVIFGHELRPFPDPTPLMQPPTHGPGGDLQLVLNLECSRQRGTTPAGATPAIHARRRLEQHRQRALEARAQDGRPDRGCALAVLVNTQAQLPRVREVNNAVDAGVRAEEEGRKGCRVLASSAQAYHVEGQKGAITGPA